MLKKRFNTLEGRNTMIPLKYILEQLVLERVRERLLAGLRKSRHGIVRHLIGCLSIFLVALGTRMQQLEQAVGNCRRNRTPYRKDTMMNPLLHAEEQLNRATHVETVDPERKRLVQSGFTAEEIVALLWLRQWYQMGGSDRIQLVRHWEFLKLLVMSGKMEV